MDTRLQPGRVFFDVGAWIGPLTIYAGRDERRLVRGRLELVSWTNVHSAMFACTCRSGRTTSPSSACAR